MKKISIASGVTLLRSATDTSVLLSVIAQIAELAPFRHMQVRGGKQMSAAMTNCGMVGWVSDEVGYRYANRDPLSGHGWPAMPPMLTELAQHSAAEAGFADFMPDACLINRYTGQAKMGVHQDKDELQLTQPVVSVSIGSDAMFRLGGLRRDDAMEKILLSDGDILVWGGPSRLRFHSVGPPLPTLSDPLQTRYNLTFRTAI